MNDEYMDLRMAAFAAATALSVGDAKGYSDALSNLPAIEGHSGNYDVDADTPIFSGSGVAH